MKEKIWNPVRLIMQLLIIGVVIVAVIRVTDPEAYCPLGGLLSLGSRIVNGAASCQMSENQMFLGIALIVGIFATGKLFCSYVCPLGTVTEWLGRLGRRLRVQIKQLPRWMDKGLRSLKYALLFPVLWFTVNTSELWCKKIDPYYAATTGFGADVVFWWALSLTLLLILGSVFIRQFWCKYLCPLNGLSNIFMNGVFALVTLGIFLGLRLSGREVSLFWLFLVWVIGGFLIELIGKRAFLTPLLKITRNPDTCTNCKLCDRACPYAIPVSVVQKVKDLDCTMCADCVESCPIPNTLTIHRFRWKYVPALATVLLVVLSLGFASRYELATLSERWIPAGSNKSLAKYEDVIKSVKCYGTASAFLRQIKPHSGIYGLDAYARSHRVVIYYDSSEISPTDLKRVIFQPYKSEVRTPGEDAPELLSIAYFGVEGLKDNIDNLNFMRALQMARHVYGFETFFGEPVRAIIYFDADRISPEQIRDIIERRKIEYEVEGEKETVELNFKVVEGPKVIGTIDMATYKQHIFREYDRRIKGYSSAAEAQYQIFQIEAGGLTDPTRRRYLPYLMSHLSRVEGVVRFRACYLDRPVLLIYFDPARIDSATVAKKVTAPQIQVTFRSGETRVVENPFSYPVAGKILPVEEVEKRMQQLEARLSFLEQYRD